METTRRASVRFVPSAAPCATCPICRRQQMSSATFACIAWAMSSPTGSPTTTPKATSSVPRRCRASASASSTCTTAAPRPWKARSPRTAARRSGRCVPTRRLPAISAPRCGASWIRSERADRAVRRPWRAAGPWDMRSPPSMRLETPCTYDDFSGASWIRLTAYSLRAGGDLARMQSLILALLVLSAIVTFAAIAHHLGVRAATLVLGLYLPPVLASAEFRSLDNPNLFPFQVAIYYAGIRSTWSYIRAGAAGPSSAGNPQYREDRGRQPTGAPTVSWSTLPSSDRSSGPVRVVMALRTAGHNATHLIRVGGISPEEDWKITRVTGGEFEGQIPGTQIRVLDHQASSGHVEFEVNGVAGAHPWNWLRHFIEVTNDNAHLLQP